VSACRSLSPGAALRRSGRWIRDEVLARIWPTHHENGHKPKCDRRNSLLGKVVTVLDGEARVLAVEFDRALDSWCGWTLNHQRSVRVRYVARLLRERGVWPELVRRWTVEDERGDGDAACRIGWVLLDRGDEAGSRRAFARAVGRGNLAATSKEHGERARAGEDTHRLAKESERARQRQEQADQRADERGDADAAYRIGHRLVVEAGAARRGDYSAAKRYGDQGEAALRRALQRGSADAAAELGDQAYEEYPDFPESDEQRGARALPLYRRADELGHPRGSWWLGMILDDLGDHDGAVAAMRRAEARGDPSAAGTLGLLLRRRTPPDWEGAEAAHRRAVDIDYDERVWGNLGAVLAARGDLAGAEAAYRRAVQRDEPQAATHLRYFYKNHPDMKPPPASDW
jgi:tetratricopeptide (TPR) repeat protein